MRKRPVAPQHGNRHAARLLVRIFQTRSHGFKANFLNDPNGTFMTYSNNFVARLKCGIHLKVILSFGCYVLSDKNRYYF